MTAPKAHEEARPEAATSDGGPKEDTDVRTAQATSGGGAVQAPFGDTAPRFYEKGVAAIPVHRGSKRPVPNAWQQYADELPSEADRNHWIAAYAQSNVGVVAGPQSGLCFADIDLHEREEIDAIRRVLEDACDGEESHWQRVGSKGLVLAFRYSELPNVRIKDVHGRALAEILSYKAQVVVPPSIHPDTRKPYHASTDLLDVRDDLPSLPTDIEQRLRQALRDIGYELPDQGRKTTIADIQSNGTIHDGGRNDALFAYARRLFWLGWTYDQVSHTVHSYNEAHCVPPYKADALERSIESAQKGSLARLPQTEFELAHRVVTLMSGDYCTTPHLGWLHHDGKRWATVDEAVIRRFVIDEISELISQCESFSDKEKRERAESLAQSFQRNAKVSSVTKLVHSRLMTDCDWDTSDSLLNVQDGVVDLNTGTIRGHDPNDAFTMVTAARYDPSADCPRFRQFVREIMAGDEAKVAFLQRFLGYSLFGGNPEHKVAIFYGAGRNGKSVLLETLRRVLGDYVHKANQDLLVSNKSDRIRSDIADLDGCRLTLTSETSENARLDGNMIKEMTGGELIRAERKYRDSFSFYPRFTPIMATNSKPILDGGDKALVRRLILIPFDVTFADDEQDKGLADKLYAERDQILAWLVQGYREYAAHGLAVPPVIQEETDEYARQSDIVGQFLEERCSVQPDAWSPSAELYNAFWNWCIEGGMKPWTRGRLRDDLERRGFAGKKRNGQRGHLGVALA